MLRSPPPPTSSTSAPPRFIKGTRLPTRGRWRWPFVSCRIFQPVRKGVKRKKNKWSLCVHLFLYLPSLLYSVGLNTLCLLKPVSSTYWTKVGNHISGHTHTLKQRKPQHQKKTWEKNHKNHTIRPLIPPVVNSHHTLISKCLCLGCVWLFKLLSV